MAIQRVLLILLGSVALAQAQPACLVETIAGDFAGPAPGDGGPALEAELASTVDVRLTSDGSILIADPLYNIVRRVDRQGSISPFAGTGRKGSGGDGGPAVEAQIDGIRSMALGPDGSLYFSQNFRVRRVDPVGVITTVAGNGEPGETEFGVPAVATQLYGDSIAVDSQGTLYVASSFRRQVYRVGADGVATLLAGDGATVTGQSVFEDDGRPAVEATLISPRDLVVDSDDRVYIFDFSGLGSRILRVEDDGTIASYTGGRVRSSTPDGTPPQEISLTSASQLEIDGADRLYWSDLSGSVRRLPPGGALETFASPQSSFSFLAVTPDGRVFGTRDRQVVELASDGSLSAVAGLGRQAPFGEGGPARNALVESIAGLAAGDGGEIYYADAILGRVRMIRPDGTMHRVAGTGAASSSGIVDGQAALETGLRPTGLTIDDQGRVLLSEENRSRVLRVESDGSLTRIAGDGMSWADCPFDSCGEGGPADEAPLPRPGRLAFDSLGNLYVQQRSSAPRRGPRDWIRRVSPDGIITTLPTTPSPGPATTFAAKPGGGLYIATPGFGGTLWTYDADGDLSEIAGTANSAVFGDGMAVHPNGEIYFEEGAAVRRFDSAGRKFHVAGDTWGIDVGADGPVEDLRLWRIQQLVFTRQGDLIIADVGSRRIYRIRDVASCPANRRPQLSSIVPMRNGASFVFGVSPGAIFSIFGLDLGPADLATATLDGSNFPTEVGGTRVLIDGTAAPLIFSLEGQVSGVLPWSTPVSLGAERSSLVVERDGLASSEFPMFVRATSPAFFTFDSSGRGPVAALNQDGTVNTADNPAAPGTIVVFFATGFGATNPPGQDGALTAAPLPVLVETPTLRINGTEAELLYAGPAPGLVSGVVQLNARIPPDAASGRARVEARSGNENASLVEVHVGP